MKIIDIKTATDNRAEYNAVYIEDGTIILNRKTVRSATQRPLDQGEDLVNAFCDKVKELESAMQDFIYDTQGWYSEDAIKENHEKFKQLLEK